MVGPAKEIIDRLGVDCKEGGSFYVCQDKPVQFIGCCTLDPCKTDDGNCPTENLRNTTFNKLYYSQFKAQSCLSNAPQDIFYTCANNDPPFMGCCAQNPCQSNGCAAANLSSAVLSKNKENASVFLPAEAGTNSRALSPGATAGIAIGAVVCSLVMIVLGLMWFRGRAKAKSNNPSGQPPSWMSPSTATTPFLGNYTNLNTSINGTPPPYSSPPMQLQGQQQQGGFWQSPPAGSYQFQGPYDNRRLLGMQSSGYVPGLISSNEDGWRGQQPQQTVVQELPPQHGLVELPEEQKAGQGQIHPIQDGDSSNKLGNSG
ncbi:unnamed protein product [Clonostachys solani]|uniref:Uncharacterized protein n=1 Tax=Clonostachys solani TaxID=160281 RepID=A0A9N9W2V0_9HYPO|nr:unnamed protein product [Clonostachys solani]